MNKKIILILTIVLGFIIFCSIVGYNLIKSIKEEDNKVLENSGSNKKSVILYFSATGTTKEVANKIANITGYDIIEIVPKIKYTSDDLNYNKNNSRANKEQNDDNSRPQIESILNIEKYDIIYLGYPIWWGEAPKVILTLLDNYNFNGKTIIPFCTSGSSGISQSENTLKSLYKDINWLEGKRFNSSISNDDIKKWLDSLNIKEDNKMYIKINKEILIVSLENNSSVDALLEKLKQGDIKINMHDYANFEKVGELGFNLPRNDKNITTAYGDVILYQGNQITIYYDTNNWNFTKLGHIDNITQKELKDILGNEDVVVTFTLNK